MISYSLFHAFFSSIYYLGNNYIVEGNLDRILLRPLDPLFQIYSERVDIEDIGEAAIGLAVLLVAAVHLHLHWGPLQIAMLILFIACGLAVFLGVFTAVASMSFWVKKTGCWPSGTGSWKDAGRPAEHSC